MDTLEADRQIKQMIAFIKQEAKEKAEEIRQKTSEDKSIEKLSYKAKESKVIREEFEKLRKEKLTLKKIHRSTKINEARFTVMSKRNDLLNILKKEIASGLNDVHQNPQYGKFLRFLIVESCLAIMEDTIEVICRKEDLKIVEGEINNCKEEYCRIIKRDCGVTPKLNLSLNKEGKFLPPHPSSKNQGESCSGGVVLSACNGRITLNNTFEARLDKAFADQKPTMRAMLFGVRPPPANAYGQ